MLRAIARRRALGAAVAVGLLAGFVGGQVAPELAPSTRWLLAWDLAVTVFLAGATWRMAPLSPAELEQRAADQDEGRYVILAFCLVAAGIGMGAMGVELHVAKLLHGADKGGHVLFAFVTVGLSWLFVHLIFAVHYAHEYYAPDEGAEGTRMREGLRFPGDEPPDYWDFVHFAVVIGVAAQTADVAITGKSLRRLVTLHGVVAFVFNTVVLALSINLAASLFS